MKADIPKLWFKKTHVETGNAFSDFFSERNCPLWRSTPLQDLEELVENRIEKLNFDLAPRGWKYEIIGWFVNKEKPE